MNFLIRADASLAIGSGHIMRCLTLARALKADGHGVHFVCRALNGHLADWIRAQGFACSLLESDTADSQPENPAPPVAGAPPHAHWLPLPQEQDAADCAPLIAAQRPDWIICDHYALDAVWQRAARAVCGSRLMVIDDLCDRAHDADLLLDQTLKRRAFANYNRAFAPARTDFDWLSRERAEVDAYIADPLCGFTCTAAFYRDLARGGVEVGRPETFAATPVDLPILVVSGSADPVGRDGAGVREVVTAYRRAGVREVSLRLYAGARHELLNETNREQVTADLLVWVGAHV